ncbi:MAG: hypothetical protein V1676_05865 [Candidatus Diapherotrites archaeon]
MNGKHGFGRSTAGSAVFALFSLALLLAFAGNVFSANYVLDVNQTGDNFEVGTKDFNLFFEQYYGGGITKAVDLNRDGAGKADFVTSAVGSWSVTYYSLDPWVGIRDGLGGRLTDDDNGAQLWKAEGLDSRVQMKVTGALIDWDFSPPGPKYDLNFAKTNTIYPVPGGIKIAVHLELTDTNSVATTYGRFSNCAGNPSTWIAYTDNNLSDPAGSEWWRARQRTTLGATSDANTVVVIGYAKRAADSKFYNKKFDPDSAGNWSAGGWYSWTDSALTEQFDAGETDYINYVIYIASTTELGRVQASPQEIPDENMIDYIMLDYRNPDNLFMNKGTTQGFDFNTGAYLITTDSNRVDFNMCTNGVMNDQNTWDTNRYYPAFQISDYNASTVPVMKVNGAAKTMGVDYVSDVNTTGKYAVVVWLGALTGNDENAQFTIATDLTAPTVSISSPSGGSSTAANSMNIVYSGSDANSAIKKYYVQMDSLGWVDNGMNITRKFFGLAPGSHTAYVIAVDTADNNSAQASVTFTLTAPEQIKKYLDVNATGQNFEAGTPDFNIFFLQNIGGSINKITDLNLDSATKTNFVNSTSTTYFEYWSITRVNGSSRTSDADTSARLRKNEDLAARAKITSEGAITDGSAVGGYDLNFTKTYSIYPNKKVYVHTLLTDTNTGPTDYSSFRHVTRAKSGGTFSGIDNNDSSPLTGDNHWHDVGRIDMNSDFDGNTIVGTGYDANSGITFYTHKWNPDYTYTTATGSNPGQGGYACNGLSPDFISGETDFINYLLVIANTKETGHPEDGNNLFDAYFLDYRTPDRLFMITGTSQNFDSNVGAYKLTASSNTVDFNISTRVGATDVNRYKPAFEIANYTASNKPLLKHNGVLKNEGTDYIADVNTLGDYAVVVWMGDILTTDVNAEFTISSSFSGPTATISSPAAGSSTAANSMNIVYSASDANAGIKKYYVQMDSQGWIDNNLSITRKFFGLAPGSHTAYLIAVNDADLNSSTASVTFTLTAPAATKRYLDVNATGQNFEVGTADFNIFFQQSRGGGLNSIIDLNRDGVIKTNLSRNPLSFIFDDWLEQVNGNQTRTMYDDNGAQLWKAEDLNSRVKINAKGALMNWSGSPAGPKWDLNFSKTNTIYPIPGGLRVAVHLELTDTNSSATATTTFHHSMSGVAQTYFVSYTDNNVTSTAGSEWWHALQRIDSNSDFDANTVFVTGYAKRAADSGFYNKKWDPSIGGAWDYLINYSSTWYMYTSVQFQPNETDYVNYLIYLASTKELGAVNGYLSPDENFIDYRMLDYRNPDNLFMKTGTFQEFDFNTGAYLVTAAGNKVDFNICTNGIMNDQNLWDTNRYSPAFEIANYTASTKPLLKYNEAVKTEGVDYVSDVNNAGDYAVVVWLGSLTGNDENAQLTIDDNFFTPNLEITSPPNHSTSENQYVTIAYSIVDTNNAIERYFVKADDGAWVDNALNTSYTFSGLSNGMHTLYSVAHDISDNNSNTAYVWVNVSPPGTASVVSGTPAGGPEQPAVPADAGQAPAAEVPKVKEPAKEPSAEKKPVAKKEAVQEPPAGTLLQASMYAFQPSAGEISKTLSALGRGEDEIKNAEKANAALGITRIVSVVSNGKGAEEFSTEFTVSAKNNSWSTVRNVKVIENVPKAAAATAEKIRSSTGFTVLENDPIIEFALGDIAPGEEKVAEYSVAGQLDKEVFSSMGAPIATGAVEENLLDNILPAMEAYPAMFGASIIVIIALMAVLFYILRKRRAKG